MSGNCEKCLKGITKGRYPGVKCGMCVSLFHIKCAEISEEVLKDLKLGATTWLCPDCRLKTDSSIIDDAYVDSVAETINKNNNHSLSDLVIILQGMQSQLDAVKTSLNFLCQSFDDMKATMSSLTKDSQRLTQQFLILEKKYEEQEKKINTMEAQLDRPAQELNNANIVICGIPHNCEDIAKIIINVLGVVGIHIAVADLVSIKRMVHNIETNSLLKNSFIVKLQNSALKSSILNTFRKKKFVCLHELGNDYSMYQPNQRIIFLHHLTRFQSRLYNEAKNVKNKHNFQFLWCKDNNIYLRQTADSKVHQIFSFNDINQLSNFTSTSDSSAGNSSAQSCSSADINRATSGNSS